MLGDPIHNFVEALSSLPSMGPRQATRLAFKLIREGRGKIEEISSSVAGLKNLKMCVECFFPHAGTEALCLRCVDRTRTGDVVMIVEKETDLLSLERAGRFPGKYLVLGEFGRAGVLDHSQKLRIESLKSRFLREGIGIAEEIIIAFNPDTYGDINAAIVKKELDKFAKRITRLGRGIPTGGEIEFADSGTLEAAIQRRS